MTEEPRSGAGVVAPRPLRIGVIGSAQADEADAAVARAVGSAIGRIGAVTVCGGLGGIMSAVAEGAAVEGGTVIGILPGADPEAAAPGVSIPLATGLGEARNVLIARASESVIAIAGEWGTLSEAALCRKFGVPVVGLNARLPDGVADETVSLPAEAVARAVQLAQARRAEGP